MNKTIFWQEINILQNTMKSNLAILYQQNNILIRNSLIVILEICPIILTEAMNIPIISSKHGKQPSNQMQRE